MRVVESLALPFQNYELAFTPAMVTAAYGGRVNDAMLIEAGYVHSEGDANWWVPSGRAFYSPGTGDTPAQELAYARQHFFRRCARAIRFILPQSAPSRAWSSTATI